MHFTFFNKLLTRSRAIGTLKMFHLIKAHEAHTNGRALYYTKSRVMGIAAMEALRSRADILKG